MTYSQYAYVEAFLDMKQKSWITAALRDEQFFSLAELNRAIREKLELFNHKLFQKKVGGRISLFFEEEKPLLTPVLQAAGRLTGLRLWHGCI